jgi:hypothetical protein
MADGLILPAHDAECRLALIVRMRPFRLLMAPNLRLFGVIFRA